MKVKTSFFHAGLSALGAATACIIYNMVYSQALDVNFSQVLNAAGIIGACLFGCVLMGVAYYLGYKWKGQRALGWINLLIALLSFASIAGVLGAQLPVSLDSPELFPGLAIPMHFFPALFFFALAPFFKLSDS